MSPPDRQTPPLSVVSWSRDDADRWETVFYYSFAGFFGGLLLLGVLLLLVVTPSAILDGDPGHLLLPLLAFLFGGPFSLLTISVAASEDSLDTLLPVIDRYRPKPLLVASVAGAVAFVLAGFFPPLFYGYLVGFVVLAVFVSIRRTAGTLDVANGTLSMPKKQGSERVYDLDGLQSVTTHRLGGVVVFRFRFGGSRSLTGPSWLAVPADRAGEVHAGLMQLTGRETDSSNVSPAAASVLGLFGVGTLALAAGLFVVSQRASDADLVALGYMAAFLAFFGVLFLFVAVRSQR
ncbi:hypothetical protein [Haloferax larsenii]|uniref:PH domain-containing protein n=1 Tax=Haloferax larsenii TaxID=302484 RepID=A0A1H7NGD4_HALLR|nr:hypothetical protein [Haloferax larsenii]SEL22379.1 hypothetical protein SAMN04488691_103304 [Haloferax larsenii]